MNANTIRVEQFTGLMEHPTCGHEDNEATEGLTLIESLWLCEWCVWDYCDSFEVVANWIAKTRQEENE